ncbi:MAG TPA: hypothetical protein VGF28_14970 [Thermoanaerobaculia bacterium]|jgi:hypothetical protein
MSESLQFDRAEFSAETPARVVCTACTKEVVQSYYELAGTIICSHCRESREQALHGLGLGRFLRAAGAGLAVGIAGAAVWYGVRVVTEYELGLIAIAIGFAVGKAVSWGSHGKGGWLYQLLAIVLTYTSIVMNYVPDVVKGMMDGTPGPAPVLAYVVGFVISYAVPFMGGVENIIGLLIIGFGLFEAWKLNKRVDADMTGPYAVAPAAMPAPVPNV